MAHDLNNVLTGIVSYPDLLLLDLAADSPLRKPLKAIQSSGQKAAAIVQDLLTLARRGVRQTDVLNINNFVTEYVGSPEYRKFRDDYPAVHVEIDLKPGLLNIRGSEIHLRKSLANLITNAAEAQPDSGQIFISTENRYVDQPIEGYDTINEGDYALLRVADKGIGMSAEDIERIFEPFYTKKVLCRSGTGIGMAVVWGTVQDHEAYIHIDSQPAVGTTFELYFPVTREEIRQDIDTIPIEGCLGRGEKVLIVDDIEYQREIASCLLQKLGYETVVVVSGETAVEYLRDNDVDLVMLDVSGFHPRCIPGYPVSNIKHPVSSRHKDAIVSPSTEDIKRFMQRWDLASHSKSTQTITSLELGQIGIWNVRSSYPKSLLFHLLCSTKGGPDNLIRSGG